MKFNVLKNFNLSIEMTLMSYFQKIAEHLNPEFVSGIGFEDNSSDIVTK